jgi:hypothetical protein
MGPEEVQILLRRLGLVLPMLYVGITLMSDPARLIQLSRSLASVLDELQPPWMQKPKWKKHMPGQQSTTQLQEGTRRRLQICGAGIAAIALFLVAAA